MYILKIATKNQNMSASAALFLIFKKKVFNLSLASPPTPWKGNTK